MRGTKLLVVAILLLFSISLNAGTTGKLMGKVTDLEGNPIEFAKVQLKGTEIGAEANDKGVYIIINIPAGTYDVDCFAMDRAKVTVKDIKINLDLTTTYNFKLPKSSIEMPEVVVTAEKELVKKGETGTGRKMNADETQNMAVDGLNDLIAITAGVSNVGGELHFRGGRSNEVQFTVDGLSVSDPVDGRAALSVDPDMIQDMNVITGGLPAEYGNAQSGMVNVVTKDGSAEYTGKIEYSTDHLFSDGSNMDEVKLALGGPLLTPLVQGYKEKLTFYLNGVGSWTDGRAKDYYVTDPAEELKYLLNTDYDSRNPYEGRDDLLGYFDLGNRNFNDYSANFKTKYEFTNTTNITLGIRGERSTTTPYAHNWRYALDHFQETENNKKNFTMTFDKTMNGVNLRVKGSYFENVTEVNPVGISKEDFFWIDENKNYPLDERDSIAFLDYNEDGVIDQDYGYYDPSFWQYSIEGISSPRNLNTWFVVPGTYSNSFIYDKNVTMNFRADLEYQLNLIHGFKTGLEVIRHKIEKDRLFNPGFIYTDRYQQYLTSYETPYDSILVENTDTYTYLYNTESRFKAYKAASGETDGYIATPWQIAYYLQDKMEYAGMIINAGMRFDFLYLGKDYKVYKADGTTDIIPFDSSDRLKMTVSPRLGISHPISEFDKISFSYNYQSQLPPLQFVFTSASPQDAVLSDAQITVGSPDLEEQTTITYQVGLAHAVGENYLFEVSSYYKNTYNYVSTVKVVSEADETVNWTKYISEDYGSAKGIDLSFQRYLHSFISGSVSYSLAWSDGNNSETVVQDEATNLREFPLDWDTRHDFKINAEFRVGDNETFTVPFTTWDLPFDDFAVSMTYNFASGKPYTPSISINNTQVVLDTNSERMEYYDEANLSLNKKFNLGSKSKIKLYVDFNNIFDKRNELAVFTLTGDPYQSGTNIEEADGVTYDETRYLRDYANHDPYRVTNGRTITAGISFNWE